VTDQLDVVVTGAGIAGLTAGLTSARLGRSTLILTGGVPGGLLLSIDRIDGAPGHPDGVPGYDLCPIAQEQAVAAGAELSMAELVSLTPADGGWRLTTSEGEIGTRSVILATGASFAELGVPGEERLRGHGVSHCASCDAPLLRERTAVVVGGGDSALQEALTLAESVAAVLVLQREDGLTAQDAYRKAALDHPRIEIRTGVEVEEVLGADRVAGVRTRSVASGAVEELAADAVFAYIGLDPNTAFLDGLVELDLSGRIVTDASLRTAQPGLLAAGIVRAGAAGRAAAAAGDGAAAAVAASRYLGDGEWETDRDAVAATFGDGGSAHG
jgi:thioredoxin reductase (NADPH)